MKYRTHNREKGFTLFYAVLMSSLLLAIGLAILNIALKEFILSSGARDSGTALYAADSALECALYWDSVTRPFGYYSDGLAEGLAGYWRFEEDANTQEQGILLDSSRSAVRLGVVGGGLSWLSGGDGWIGQALEFDGNQSAFTEAVPALSDADKYSVSAWVNIPSNAGAMDILSLGDYDEYTWSFTPEIPGKEPVPPQLTVKAGTNSVSVDYTYYLDKWTNIIAVFDGNLLTVYVGADSPPSVTAPPIFGAGNIPFNLGMNIFSGKIDDVRIYNRALSLDEVSAIKAFQVRQAFVPPIEAGSAGNMACADTNNINAGDGGQWSTENISAEGVERWKTTFEVSLKNGTFAKVEVIKGEGIPTEIIARGYNVRDLQNPRALERALFATY